MVAVEKGDRPQWGDPSRIWNPRSVEDGGGERKGLKGSTEEPITALQGRRLPGWCLDWSQPGKRELGYSACIYLMGVCADEPTHTHRSNTVTFKTK